MSEPHWREGNKLELLENGEDFFPSVFADIGNAKSEVLIETFIIFEDPVGMQLKEVLVAAGKRGVRVELTVDGYGCAALSAAYISALTAAGVRVHLYDPQPTVLGMRTNLFRRLHRKIVVVDATIAHIGGINYSEDHLIAFGETAKQDYSLRAQGPIVADIHAFTLAALGATPRQRPPLDWNLWSRLRLRMDFWQQRPAVTTGSANAIFVTRDNHRHYNDIEQHYRLAIRAAQREIIIANAYFFPGYRFMRELQNAAKRGVAVHLLIQGKPDKWIVQFAAQALYGKMLKAGVKVYEYCARPMHAKVAVIDDEWVTVGSSNLDPLSLYLNLECNIIARDAVLNADLRARLQHLMQHSCKPIPADLAPHRTLWRQMLSYIAFHMMRRFPAWAGWLPAHTPRREVHALPQHALPVAMPANPP